MSDPKNKPAPNKPASAKPIEDPLKVIEDTAEAYLRNQGIDPKCVKENEKRHGALKSRTGEEYDALLVEACPLSVPAASSPKPAKPSPKR